MSRTTTLLLVMLLVTGMSTLANAFQINIPSDANITINAGDNSSKKQAQQPVTVNDGDATIRVGGSSLRFNGQIIKGHEYTGSCPVELKFSWGIVSTAPTTVSYTFARSDGATDTRPHSLNITKANHSTPIYDTWRLGGNNKRFEDFKGYKELVVDAPNPITYKIPFTLHCQ